MEVLRKMNINVDEFKIGDQILISLKGFGTFTATVQLVNSDRTIALFLTDNCVTSYYMNEDGNNEGGFLESDLRRYINTELIAAFPQKIQEKMVKDRNNDLLSIPSRTEIFGDTDYFDIYEKDSNTPFPLMQFSNKGENNYGNRICMYGDTSYGYWLTNIMNDDTMSKFASVAEDGKSRCFYAHGYLGVRLKFYLSV